MQCRAKLLALARSTVHEISIGRSNEAVMASLDRLRVPSTCCLSNAPSALVQHSSSRRKLRSLSSLASQCPHRVLKTRAGHTTPSSPATATSSEAWDACDLSSDPWFRSGSGDSVTDAVAKDEDISVTGPDEEWYKIQAEDDEWFRREEQFYEARILEQEGWAKPHIARHESQPDFLGLSESSLFSQCRMDTFRASGPGGQHRNKTDSGVRLTHLPTGVVAQAVDDRSQHKNRAVAMSRLRMLIASKVRRPVKLLGYKPPPELLRLLPPEPGKKGGGDKIGVNHPDFAKGIQALLDLLSASKGYICYAAALLRVSPNVISKILTMDKTVLQGTNELLVSKGQKPFK